MKTKLHKLLLQVYQSDGKLNKITQGKKEKLQSYLNY